MVAVAVAVVVVVVVIVVAAAVVVVVIMCGVRINACSLFFSFYFQYLDTLPTLCTSPNKSQT